MLADTSGAEYGVYATAVVTLILGLLAYFRPTKDVEARTQADAAVSEATAAKLLVDSAMEMARDSKAAADRAMERAGRCEQRCIALERRLLTVEAERDQLHAEAQALAEIVDSKVLPPAAKRRPRRD